MKNLGWKGTEEWQSSSGCGRLIWHNPNIAAGLLEPFFLSVCGVSTIALPHLFWSSDPWMHPMTLPPHPPHTPFTGKKYSSHSPHVWEDKTLMGLSHWNCSCQLMCPIPYYGPKDLLAKCSGCKVQFFWVLTKYIMTNTNIYRINMNTFVTESVVSLTTYVRQ